MPLFTEAQRARIRERDRARYWRDRDIRIVKQRARNKKNRTARLEKRREARAFDPTSCMLQSAKRRAGRRGMDFNLTLEDILIPDVCPVLGLWLEVGKGMSADNSPSLDRIENSKGYVKGNVVVTSLRANRIKNDASPAELRQVADFYERIKA